VTVRELAALLQEMVERGHGDAVAVRLSNYREKVPVAGVWLDAAGTTWNPGDDRVVIE
jgi:hypothetical protein